MHARGDREAHPIIYLLAIYMISDYDPLSNVCRETAQHNQAAASTSLARGLSRTVRCAHKPSATRRSRAAGGYLWHALARDELIILCSADQCDPGHAYM